MRLERVRVTNYKSVLDSEWFSVGDLTCLVGKNESGKTALIEAIEKLNSVDDERIDFSNTDYPRLLWTSNRSDSETIAVASEWRLSDEEADHINSITGTAIIDPNSKVTVTKDYGNSLKWSVPLDYAAAVTSLLAISGLHETEKEAFTGA